MQHLSRRRRTGCQLQQLTRAAAKVAARVALRVVVEDVVAGAAEAAAARQQPPMVARSLLPMARPRLRRQLSGS